MGLTSSPRPAIEALESRRLLAVVWALSTANQLIRFDAAADDPQFWRAVVDIDGMQENEEMRSIDFRPATGHLYGMTDQGRLYTINLNSGQTTPVIEGQIIDFTGEVIKIDFNPATDILRVTTNADENYRVNPDTGELIGTDTNLVFADEDPNEGTDPVIIATAHDRPFWGADQTTLYAIDSNTDTLVRIGTEDGGVSPDTGQVQTVGDLGIDVIRRSAFDIYQADGQSRGLAILQRAGIEEFPQLYEINLETGQATAMTALQAKLIQDMAIAPPETSGVILTNDNRLARFDTGEPLSLYAPVNIFGLRDQETVVSVDFRPTSRELYGVSNQNRLYLIDIVNGAATSIGERIEGTVVGQRITADFTPDGSTLRVVTDAGENWRVNPDTGALIAADPALAYTEGADPVIVGGAYSANRPGGPQTTLFHIDAQRNELVRQGEGTAGANAGTLTPIGPLGININNDAHGGMDIFTREGVDTAWALLTPSAGTRGLYGVNLDSGAVRRIHTVGDIFGAAPIVDFSFDPRT